MPIVESGVDEGEGEASLEEEDKCEIEESLAGEEAPPRAAGIGEEEAEAEEEARC